jgi:hypothetical protein
MAYTAGTQASAPRQSTISTAIDDFDPVLDRAQTCGDRLQKLHDRIHGPQPSAVSNDKPPTPPHSLIASINERRSRLAAILDDMERTIGGLEGGV